VLPMIQLIMLPFPFSLELELELVLQELLNLMVDCRIHHRQNYPVWEAVVTRVSLLAQVYLQIQVSPLAQVYLQIQFSPLAQIFPLIQVSTQTLSTPPVSIFQLVMLSFQAQVIS